MFVFVCLEWGRIIVIHFNQRFMIVTEYNNIIVGEQGVLLHVCICMSNVLIGFGSKCAYFRLGRIQFELILLAFRVGPLVLHSFVYSFRVGKTNARKTMCNQSRFSNSFMDNSLNVNASITISDNLFVSLASS